MTRSTGHARGPSAACQGWLGVTSLMLLACIGSATAALPDTLSTARPDWPQWRGPDRDGKAHESNLLASWPEGGPTLLWKREDLGKGWSSPIIAASTLYITGDVGDTLMIFALGVDGKPLWQVQNGLAWKRPYPGSRASCVFSEGLIYHLNARGRLVCLEADSGYELWHTNILDRFDGKNITWALSECLLIDGDRLIVTPGGKTALMAALDKSTGQTVWTTEPLGDDQASYASPILFEWEGRRLIASCSSAHGFGVDADTGQLLWTVPLKNPHGVNAASPVYGSGCIFYCTPYAENGRCYRLKATDETVGAEHLWTCPVDAVTGGALLINDTLYAAGYKQSKWWMAIDWRTGQTQHELKGLTTGAALYADERLYLFDEKGTAALVTPGPDGLQITGQFQISNDKIKDAWSHPVVHNGRLYLRYHQTLWCYDVKQ
ncbi:MAG: PQQ-binding-like beta-propeller repeat protein [Planctomycetes bacterium]|nr:PQQ-binding-like beta-propeller repeat protein [Planctomycetota bacterium]